MRKHGAVGLTQLVGHPLQVEGGRLRGQGVLGVDHQELPGVDVDGLHKLGGEPLNHAGAHFSGRHDDWHRYEAVLVDGCAELGGCFNHCAVCELTHAALLHACFCRRHQFPLVEHDVDAQHASSEQLADPSNEPVADLPGLHRTAGKPQEPL